jgi:predicted transcriptional regulator YdeE
MNKKIVLAAILLVFLGLIVVYFQRGGGVKPNFYKVQTAAFYIAGTSYEGKSTDKNLQTVIRQAHQYLENKQLKGILSIIYEGNPDTNKPIKATVGIIVEDTAGLQLPKDYKLRLFPAMRAVRAETKAHVSVTPNADKINEELRDFARKNGLQIDTLYIERYYNEEHTAADIKVKDF